jgi:hypothetical protein
VIASTTCTKFISNQYWYFCFLLCPFYTLYLCLTICLLINKFGVFFQFVEVLFVLNLATFPFQKLCARCHVLNIVVATINVHCNVCCVKITIHEFQLWWLEQVQLLHTTKLWGKLILVPISQLASFGEHIEQMVLQHESPCVLVVNFFSQIVLLLVMACHFPSSSNPHVDLESPNTKRKLHFDG